MALLRCNGAQVDLIAAFRSSALLGLVSLIFLLTIPIDFCHNRNVLKGLSVVVKKKYFPILGFILRHLDLNNANVLYNSIIACLILCTYSIQ